MQELDPSGQLLSRDRLLILIQAAFSYQFGELFNIVRRKNRIVKEFLVAFVAVDCRQPFRIPRAGFEDLLASCTRSGFGPSEKAFCDEVMRGRVRPPQDGGFGILTRSMDSTPADCASPVHLHLQKQPNPRSRSAATYCRFNIPTTGSAPIPPSPSLTQTGTAAPGSRLAGQPGGHKHEHLKEKETGQ